MKATPSGSTAVMARRVAGADDEDAQRKLWRALDFYPTPPWAARAGAELIKRIDPQAQSAWEPACGEGHMAEPLGAYFDTVHASDIHPHGYGAVYDFLAAGPGKRFPVDWVITNPPFLLASEFLQRGLDVATRGVALLCRLAFLESETRYQLLYGDTPVTIVAPFTERVAMQLGSWNPKGATATAYAWFIWVKGSTTRAQLDPIPPGAKRRLSRTADVQRFALMSDAPLLDGGEA